MKDAPSLLKIPNRNVQTFGFVYHDTNGLNHGPEWKTQLFLLSEICTVILLQGLLRERQFEEVRLEHEWEKVPNWECLFVNRKKGLFLSVYVDDIKLAGKTENIEPTWKILMDDGDLGESTSFFFDHVYLGCTQREFKISKDIVENCNPGYQLEEQTNCFIQKNQKQTFHLGPMTWKVMQRNALKDIANLQTNQLNNFWKWCASRRWSSCKNSKCMQWQVDTQHPCRPYFQVRRRKVLCQHGEEEE